MSTDSIHGHVVIRITECIRYNISMYFKMTQFCVHLSDIGCCHNKSRAAKYYIDQITAWGISLLLSLLVRLGVRFLGWGADKQQTKGPHFQAGGAASTSADPPPPPPLQKKVLASKLKP